MTRAIELQRDPFARATLMRHVFARGISPDPCKWCGQPRGRFIYFWDADDRSRADEQIRDAYQRDLVFCSVGCWRSFHS